MSEEARMRLDVWLWRARFFRTRAAASEAVQRAAARIERAGQVRRVDRPATPVAAGDVISFAGPAAGTVVVVRVLALPERRGPAAEAAACYRRLEPGGEGG
jgi:ribosome-associated heat shock protein Hsp15